jgi:hypothetical protein
VAHRAPRLARQLLASGWRRRRLAVAAARNARLQWFATDVIPLVDG